MKNKKWKYVIYKLDQSSDQKDVSSIKVDKLGGRDEEHQQFLDCIPSDQPRWVVYDLEY